MYYEHHHWNQDQATPRQPAPEEGASWRIPFAIAAFALIAGLLFYNPNSNRVTTASNNGPLVTQPGVTSGSGAEPTTTQPPTPR
jgi:hypothetical protein